MPEWKVLGPEGMLSVGNMTEVQVDGQPVLVARAGGVYYAAEGRCPHLRGKLAQGKLTGTVVTCPLHHSQFDLTDGRVVAWSPALPAIGRKVTVLLSRPRALSVYPTRLQGGNVWVEMP